MQFLEGQNADNLGLSGEEEFTIRLPDTITPGCKATVLAQASGGASKEFEVDVRFDTDVELSYYKNGGILNYMIRSILNK